MSSTMRPAMLAVTFALFSGAACQAVAQTSDDYRLFATCPVYRDTDLGRKSGCWLAQSPEDGLRYDVTLAPSKPDYAHAVLVEGRIAPKQDSACGGVTLDPVSVSILDAPCPRHMLPPEGYPGRRFALPTTNVPQMDLERPPEKGPFAPRSFALFFEFDSSFVSYQFTDYYLDLAVHWLRSAHPRRIVVTGYAATAPVVVAGKPMAERPEVAQERAEVITRSLVMLGFDPRTIRTRAKSNAEPLENPAIPGLVQNARRRVEIRAEF